MCLCDPTKRTPWCGKPGCEMPEQVKQEPKNQCTYVYPEPCALCRNPAAHKVAHKVEEDTRESRHPLTGYLCCEHFVMLMGPLAAARCGGAIPRTPIVMPRITDVIK